MGLGDPLIASEGLLRDRTMESFIIVVYRRDGEGSDAVVAGLVERSDDGTRQPFRSMEELWNLLKEPRHSAGRRSMTRGADG